jgi:hypothetical protein
MFVPSSWFFRIAETAGQQQQQAARYIRVSKGIQINLLLRFVFEFFLLICGKFLPNGTCRVSSFSL